MDNNLLFAIATIIAGFAVAIIARIIVRWLEKFAETTETKWDDIIVAAIGTPVQVGIVALSIYIALKSFDVVPAQYAWVLSGKVLDSIYILLGTWIAASLLHDIVRIYGRQIAESTEGDMDDRIVDLLELAVRYIVWFVGLMLVMVNLEINITPFLAGAGIAGIALALAAQDLISNFFGGAIITVDKPFKVGDRIRMDNFYGDVLSVGTRSTRVKTLDNEIVTIPNNKLTTNSVINYSEPDPKLRMTIPITVAYGTDPIRVKTILLEIAHEAIRKNDFLVEDPEPTAFFVEFSESSINFIVRVWTRHIVSSEKVKDTINCLIAERFAQEGIEIPFPQLEVRMKK